MSGEAKGCLGGAALAFGAVLMAPLLAIYALVMGKKSHQAERPRLPYLAIGRMNAADRATLERARKAAEAAIEALFDVDDETRSDLATEDVTADVIQLVERIYELGERLAEARTYAKRHDPDRIAREQADLELRIEEASGLDERASLREAMDALAERARHAATVNQEIRTLSARLTAAASVLETLQARLVRGGVGADEGTVGSEQLVADLRQHQQDARRALEAYAGTAREMERLR